MLDLERRFAWYPVRTGDGSWCWLRYVYVGWRRPTWFSVAGPPGGGFRHVYLTKEQYIVARLTDD